ncbi:MAG: metal-binding protein [Desulfuromonas sp.]|nr:metal-binding protein [Desulfuromonas sp.]
MKKTYRLLGPDGIMFESLVPGTLGGYRRKKIYGRLDCPSANAALKKGGYAKHRVFFAGEEDAIRAGYRPCGKCMKEFYRKWKAGGRPGTREYPWLTTP